MDMLLPLTMLGHLPAGAGAAWEPEIIDLIEAMNKLKNVQIVVHFINK